MQKLLVISDIHICKEGETIIGLNPLARFQQVLDTALTAHPDANALILLGDLTHHGFPEEYAQLAAALADVTIPVLPMLGNHDRREPFQAAFPNAPRMASGHVQMVHDLDHHRVILLDSLDGPPYPDKHHAGQLCDQRKAFLAQALETAEGRVPLIFIHHPPFNTGIAGMDDIKLADGDRLLGMLASHSPLHLFCGHVHRTISGTTSGVSWTIFKSSCDHGVLDLSTVDSSLSVDEPGAYGLVLLTKDGVVAHSEDVGA